MRAYNKKAEAITLTARGVASETFVVQFNKQAPHIRMYQRKQRGANVVHTRVGQFYKMRNAIQRAWSLSQEGATDGQPD